MGAGCGGFTNPGSIFPPGSLDRIGRPVAGPSPGSPIPVSAGMESDPGRAAAKSAPEHPGEPEEAQPDCLQLPEGSGPANLQQGLSCQGGAFPVPVVPEIE